MPELSNCLVKFRRFVRFAKGILSLVLLALEILKRILDLLCLVRWAHFFIFKTQTCKAATQLK